MKCEKISDKYRNIVAICLTHKSEQNGNANIFPCDLKIGETSKTPSKSEISWCINLVCMLSHIKPQTVLE